MRAYFSGTERQSNKVARSGKKSQIKNDEVVKDAFHNNIEVEPWSQEEKGQYKLIMGNKTRERISGAASNTLRDERNLLNRKSLEWAT